jgi:catechol 2,3-dioxygenase-like lactoylglutathione lyase family enzyme
MTTPSIPGIHHITAIAGDPQRNLEFYTTVLGLRLVKLTVNFDDPGTYHFYFDNEKGTPRSILTFFSWPHAPPRRRRLSAGHRNHLCCTNRIAGVLAFPLVHACRQRQRCDRTVQREPYPVPLLSSRDEAVLHREDAAHLARTDFCNLAVRCAVDDAE